jgi:hypothetical protein
MTMIDTAIDQISGVYTPRLLAQPQRPMTQEQRILGALGLLRGPLPRVSQIWLARYHCQLARTLVFPFEARCPEVAGTVRPWTTVVSVIELISPADNAIGNEAGLLCRALRADEASIEVPLIDLEVPAENANAEPIEDYWYWFWNWRFDPGI